MSLQNPAFTVTRWSVVGMEGMWAKMWDPPTESPPPTDQLLLQPQTVPDGKGGTSLIRPNPVPEVMAAGGFIVTVNALGVPIARPTAPHTVQRSLLLGHTVPTWDGQKQLTFFTIGDSDNPSASAGTFPGPTLRMPRGVIFNSQVQGKGPPPHTIHWHGMEPTPMNDGVGHCSMELGQYGYQWQPNFMGFYFLHCHRNTMQHFEFGLYSALLYECPDTYFASIGSTDPLTGDVTLNSVPIGHCRDSKRRVACNLDDPLTGNSRFTQFPGFNRNPVDAPDPGPGPNDTQISFPTDPHAMTVPFDVEALMVFDDRDSVWSDLAKSARATFPRQGTRPGFNDSFNLNPGVLGFAAFNDFNADYWYVTGVPVPAHKGGTGDIPPGLVIPPGLNSGISGTQISVNAATGDTILIRILDAAYNFLRITLPVNAVIIAWDGRALGVAPYGHNESYLVPAGTPIDVNTMAVGRRFDALIKADNPINDFIIAEFINHKSQEPSAGEKLEVLMTARVPFVVSGTPIQPTPFAFIGLVVDQLGTPVAGCIVSAASTLTGTFQATTGADGRYTINGITNGSYTVTADIPGKTKAYFPSSQLITCNDGNETVPNIVVSIADFAPNSYQLPDALNSLRDVVGLRQPDNFEKFRYDVAPFLNAVPAPDGVIDIRDSLNILRMVVGLNPL
ncbi:MAG: carboxypeptidase regulatory-like domain-containing protein [Desulfuromonadales bacterium]|nr:carboxypeptidase regulatory-like domain-containing protein [Desulfuromonadales bacterium]